MRQHRVAGCSVLLGHQSNVSFIQNGPGLKCWLSGTPPLGAMRPSHCWRCGVPAQEPGRRTKLQGHGCRTRQVWGVLTPGLPPQIWIIRVRRVRCVDCGATMTVGPKGMLPRRWYLWPTIVWGLAGLGLEGLSATQVRVAISPWRTPATGWRQLARWVDAFCGPRAPGESRFAAARHLALRAAAHAGTVFSPTAPAAWRGANSLWGFFRVRPAHPTGPSI